MRKIFLVCAIGALLTACSKPPQYQTNILGTVGIKDHHTPHGGLLRQLCQFRVEVAGLTLGYAGSSTLLQQHNKCLTMKNGDEITVRRRTRLSGDDQLPRVMYFGKVGEVEFNLH